MQPLNRPPSVAFISAGATQLLLGPASSGSVVHTKVRSSMRATSAGSERTRKLLGRLAGFNRIIDPAAIISSHSRSYSAWEPSHQTMRSGSHSAAISSTQAIRRRCRT
jgi:hypothetical protein